MLRSREAPGVASAAGWSAYASLPSTWSSDKPLRCVAVLAFSLVSVVSSSASRSDAAPDGHEVKRNSGVGIPWTFGVKVLRFRIGCF